MVPADSLRNGVYIVDVLNLEERHKQLKGPLKRHSIDFPKKKAAKCRLFLKFCFGLD